MRSEVYTRSSKPGATASDLDLTEASLVALAGAARVLTDVIKA